MRRLQSANAPRTEFIFFGGKRIARLDLSNSAVHYYFSDHLGSSNVVTNATGATIEEESDFYPFGGERVLTDTLSDQNYKFTGKERDPESGLDYFGARYYSSPLGRFITPDWADKPTSVPYAEFGDPQSLNLYSYVRDNPINHIDPDGHTENDGAVVLNAYKDTSGGAVDSEEQAELVLLQRAISVSDKLADAIKPQPPPPPPPTPPPMQGVNPITGKDGFAAEPKGEPGNLRPGVGGEGSFGARRDNAVGIHTGLDVSGQNHFSTVYATSSGTVQSVGKKGDYGTTIVVNHGGALTSLYGHLSATGVKRGEQVRAATPIGVVGMTGNAKHLPYTEAHVHFEVRRSGRPVNPAVFLNTPRPPQ